MRLALCAVLILAAVACGGDGDCKRAAIALSDMELREFNMTYGYASSRSERDDRDARRVQPAHVAAAKAYHDRNADAREHYQAFLTANCGLKRDQSRRAGGW